MAADKDAWICDLAEEYGILDYKALPVQLLATLSVGLRSDSRIKRIMSGTNASLDTMLLAAAVDRLSYLQWYQTEDAQHGRGRPKSILEAILKKKDESPVGFENAEDLEAERKRILGG